MIDQAGGQPSGSLDTGERVVVLLGGVLAGLALVALTPVLPMIEADLARTALQSLLVKQLVGGVALAMVAGAPLAGILSDRLGLRRMLMLASVVYAASGTAGFYLRDIEPLLASRLLLGLAAASIQITSLTLINTRLDGMEREKWMGIHISAAMLGTILIHPIAGALGSIGWHWPFILYALGLIVVPLMLRSPEQPTRSAAQDAPAISVRLQAMIGWGWFPYRYLIAAILIGSLIFLPTVYVPFLLRQVSGSTPWLISLVLTADSVVGALMAMTYGRARRLLSNYAAFAFSFATIAIGTLMSAKSTGLPGIVAGMMVYGLGVGWLLANLLTSLAARIPRQRQGHATGMIKAAHFLSAPLGVTLMEPIARQRGPAYALLVVSGLAVVLLVLVVSRQLGHAARPATGNS